MIRSIFFAIITIVTFFYGISLKNEGNIHCLTAWAISIACIFLSFFSWESWKLNKEFWKVVTLR